MTSLKGCHRQKQQAYLVTLTIFLSIVSLKKNSNYDWIFLNRLQRVSKQSFDDFLSIHFSFIGNQNYYCIDKFLKAIAPQILGQIFWKNIFVILLWWFLTTHNHNLKSLLAKILRKKIPKLLNKHSASAYFTPIVTSHEWRGVGDGLFTYGNNQPISLGTLHLPTFPPSRVCSI